VCVWGGGGRANFVRKLFSVFLSEMPTYGVMVKFWTKNFLEGPLNIFVNAIILVFVHFLLQK
jgi:hypothetical protein